MVDITLGELTFLCNEPSCDLARGAVGLTSEEIQARVIALSAAPAPAGEPDELEEEDDDEADAADPADPTAIDPLGQGAPCPLCRAADPPRDGKLLAVATAGSFGGMIAAFLGSFVLLFWQRVESDSTTGTNRLLDAQRHVQGDTTTSKATTSFVIGRKITAVLLKELPFDGHLLCYGNMDADQYGTIEVPARGKKKASRKKGWYKATPQYGPKQGPPGPAARENPMYIRELQEDLIWLGYFSTSRGSPQVGVFDVYTLGAVLGQNPTAGNELLMQAIGATGIAPRPMTAIAEKVTIHKPLKVVVDSGNGLSGTYVVPVLRDADRLHHREPAVVGDHRQDGEPGVGYVSGSRRHIDLHADLHGRRRRLDRAEGGNRSARHRSDFRRGRRDQRSEPPHLQRHADGVHIGGRRAGRPVAVAGTNGRIGAATPSVAERQLPLDLVPLAALDRDDRLAVDVERDGRQDDLLREDEPHARRRPVLGAPPVAVLHRHVGQAACSRAMTSPSSARARVSRFPSAISARRASRALTNSAPVRSR